MAPTPKSGKAPRASGRKQAAQAPAKHAVGKKRPNNENDPGDTSKRSRKNTRTLNANSRTSMEENELGCEQQTSADEMMQKYAALQGLCSCYITRLLGKYY